MLHTFLLDFLVGDAMWTRKYLRSMALAGAFIIIVYIIFNISNFERTYTHVLECNKQQGAFG